MTNKIKLKCPVCGCKDADVLAVIQGKDVKVIVRCLADKGQKHQYKLDPLGKNKDWQQFFKPEFIKTLPKLVEHCKKQQKLP